ncbi:Methyltransferase type 12 [Parvibaculum lavamentivorans DS-1]|uniref:Methyltransferase type 12 n=1 Tax=Parvibaculum lavamentivorans (strain DS-1 / DSM 13023 / NCIMB 13966) TaxID=402881 RepID=A7HYE3_PARL1|nr:class I SAM-dependent methyltransferase [Parvibaculum lavamentivorans]ABS64926.1 Methyltransferase type 12 [Parvibaculum lavamentivorans DS-1]
MTAILESPSTGAWPHGFRLCPGCGAAEPLDASALCWPPGWTCDACSHALTFDDGIALAAPDLANTISGFDPADFDYLSLAELGHFWFAARRRLIVALARKYAPDARRFLEIGCGSGNVIAALALSRRWDRILGTEIHPRGLHLARQRLPGNVELMQLDARRIPFKDSFDLAGAFDVLEHIAEDEHVMAEIAKSLVRGGTFLATVPQHPSLWSASDEVAHHERRYRRGEMEEKLERAGFSVVFSTSYTVGLLPVMALSRVLSRGAPDTRDPREIARQEFEISPLINSLLAIITTAEVAMTERGIRWPAGGSRVVVARKL